MKPYLQVSEDGKKAYVTVVDIPEFIVETGANQIIEIDKLYGPLAASGVRIFLEYKGEIADWVVQSENLTTGKWEEKARWYCQENWPEREE